MAILSIPKSVVDSIINMINSYSSYVDAARYGQSMDAVKAFGKKSDRGQADLQKWFNANIKPYVGTDPTTINVIVFGRFTGNNVSSGKTYANNWRTNYSRVRMLLITYGTPAIVASLDTWFKTYGIVR